MSALQQPMSMGAEEMSWADASGPAGEEERDETSELLPSPANVRVRIQRRNSISLPAGLDTMDSPDLQLTPDSSQHDGELSDSSFTDGDMDADEEVGGVSEEETVAVNVPLRSVRRKSVMPLPILKINDIDYLDVPEHSPGNSITSINSIASLLREKIALSFPAMMRKKQQQQAKEYKLHIFVGILFLCIVSLVGFTYIFYHQQVLQRAYFDRIRFNNKERIVRVFNSQGLEVMYGFLGLGLNQDPVFRCLPQSELDDGSVCMEWMHKARLYMNYREHASERCYRITWESLSDNIFPTDCYDWSPEHGHWYGGGQTPGMNWPMEWGHVKMSPFITGDTRYHQWGNALKRYFINSNGVTIFVDPNTPLYISVNDIKPNSFCLQARHDDFAYVYHHTPLPKLNYSLCTSTKVKPLHSFLLDKNSSVKLSEEERELVNTLMTEPVWHITPSSSRELTESVISNYTEEVISLGFFRQGHVLLNEFWQPNIGDFLMDPVRFPTMEETINIMQRRGFRIIFSVQPFVSTESINFREAVREGLLVSQKGTEHHIPALTLYKSVPSAGVLDITNNRTVPWLQNKLKSLVDRYHIDSFYIDIGSAYDMPHYYRFANQLTNLDQYKTLFIDSILKKVGVVGVSSVIDRPRGPVFVSLPPFPSSWKSLKSIIPTILTYGLIGYPLVMPGPVGGDYLEKQPLEVRNLSKVSNISSVSNSSTPSHTSTVANVSTVSNSSTVSSNVTAGNSSIVTNSSIVNTSFTVVNNTTPMEDPLPSVPLPEKELYMRWMQLATFLPVMSFKHLPSKYADEKVLEMAKVLTNLRAKTINPIVKKFLEPKGGLDNGLPLIRPLWMLDPGDPACHTVVDEFSVGEELIVAPVLSARAREREVYLPAGVWKDGIDGGLRKGSRWLHSYRVPDDKIAYFVKMPDNTRF